VKILAVSDLETGILNTPAVARRFAGAGLIVSCGDLPPDYLEYMHAILEAPLVYVRGNHDLPQDNPDAYAGAINLHRRLVRLEGLLLAGMEGSLYYSRGGPQSTQAGMWANVLGLAPTLLLVGLRTGRFLDIFVSHAPPWGVHDVPDDPPHRGFKAFRWLIRAFHPALHVHGHVHVIHPAQARETLLGRTRVINACGYREIELN